MDEKIGKILPMLVQYYEELCLSGDDAHERGKAIGQMEEFVLDKAKSLGGEDTRASVYRFESHGGHREMDCLKYDGHRGRELGAMRERFCATTDDEEERVVDLAKGNAGRLYLDITKDIPHGMKSPEKKSYKCTMLAPIRAGKQIFGMISVDDPTPAIFGARHHLILNALAKCLATCYALDAARVGRPANAANSGKAQPGGGIQTGSGLQSRP